MTKNSTGSHNSIHDSCSSTGEDKFLQLLDNNKGDLHKMAIALDEYPSTILKYLYQSEERTAKVLKIIEKYNIASTEKYSYNMERVQEQISLRNYKDSCDHEYGLIHKTYRFGEDREVLHLVCVKCLKSKEAFIEWKTSTFTRAGCTHSDLMIDEYFSFHSEFQYGSGVLCLYPKNVIYECSSCGSSGVNYHEIHRFIWEKYHDTDAPDEYNNCIHKHLMVSPVKNAKRSDPQYKRLKDVVCTDCDSIMVEGFLHPNERSGDCLCDSPDLKWSAEIVMALAITQYWGDNYFTNLLIKCNKCENEHELTLEMPYDAYCPYDASRESLSQSRAKIKWTPRRDGANLAFQ